MSDAVIWLTSFEMKTNFRPIDWHLSRPRIDFIHEMKYGRAPIDPADAPDYAFFAGKGIPAKQRNNLPDLSIITGGIFFVSGAFRNLLLGFELGRSQFFEVPLYEADQKTLRPGRWFMLNIAETKNTLVPEACEGLEEKATKGYFSVPIQPNPPVVALRPEAASGVELWYEERLSTRFFLSDRLKMAIKSEKMKIRAFPLQKAKILS